MAPYGIDDSGRPITVYYGDQLARYGFGHGHPFGLDRLGSFWAGMTLAPTASVEVADPVVATRDEIERFHSAAYVDRVVRQSADGVGFLDYGDTPAFPGVYEAAAWVVGSALDAAHRLMDGRAGRAFVPIAGLHHARRDAAGGFCVFNDCGVVIELLLSSFGVKRIAYVDIDAHHGDGVYYAFEENPDIIIADIHEDGRFLYPGTGAAHETGIGAAEGTKFNIPMTPGAGDDAFFDAWDRVGGAHRCRQTRVRDPPVRRRRTRRRSPHPPRLHRGGPPAGGFAAVSPRRPALQWQDPRPRRRRL